MWPNTDLVTFTEEILNGKLQFLCSAWVVLIIPIYLLLKNLFLKKINHPALNLRVVSLVDLIFNNLFSHFLGLHDHKQTEGTDLSSCVYICFLFIETWILLVSMSSMSVIAPDRSLFESLVTRSSYKNSKGIRLHWRLSL